MCLLLLLEAEKKAHQRAASQNKVQSLPIKIFNWFSFAVAWLPFVVAIVSIIVVFIAGTEVPTTPETAAVFHTYTHKNQRVPVLMLHATGRQLPAMGIGNNVVAMDQLTTVPVLYSTPVRSSSNTNTNSTVVVGMSRLSWINANEPPSVECLA